MSDNLLASISVSSFSGDFFCFFIWGMFLCHPFWLLLCVCFCVSGRSAMTPSLGRVVLCSTCPVGSSDAVSLITWIGRSKNIPCVLCLLSCYFWVLHAIVSFVHGSDAQACWLWGSTLITVYELLYRYWSHEAEFASAGSGACQDLPLEIPLVRLIESYSDVVWSWWLGVFILGFLWGTLVQTNVRCFLWLVLGNLFGATKWFTVCGCLY